MVRKKDLIDNALMREIISIRVDTLWKMIDRMRRKTLPGAMEEGATGKLDNKGAIFIPGGLVHQDVDEHQIQYEKTVGMDVKVFTHRIEEAMQFDNATLVYPDGVAPGVNLDSGFFSKAARRINSYKKAAFRRKKKIGGKIPVEINSDDIIRSHCPAYIQPPYGARTRISTCASVGLIDAAMYFAYCMTEFNFNHRRALDFAKRLDAAQDPVVSPDGDVLYPPYIVVCHDTRYKDNSYTGLTRILGIDKFGAFATFTLEELDKSLSAELKRKGVDVTPEHLFAEHDGRRFFGILRLYAPTSMGKRSSQYTLYILSPQRDLGLDVGQIETAAKQRYWS